jgi:GNAT superfamily N-acetyltransferase
MSRYAVIIAWSWLGTAKGGGKSKSGGGSIAITTSKPRVTQAINDKMICLRQAIFDANGRDKDVLESIAPAFLSYQRHGLDLSIALQFSLSQEDMNWFFQRIKANMEEKYNASGLGWDDDDKMMELTEKGKRFLVVRENQPSSSTTTRGPIVGIVHFRFTVQGKLSFIGRLINEIKFADGMLTAVEGEALDAMAGDTTLFIGDIHLVESIQRKGLGKHLLSILELVARKQGMAMLSVPVCLDDEVTTQWLEKCRGFTPDPTLSLLGFNAEDEGFEVYIKRFGVPMAAAVKDPIAEMSAMLKKLSVAADKSASDSTVTSSESIQKAVESVELEDELDTSQESMVSESSTDEISLSDIDQDRIVEELKILYRETNGREPQGEELTAWLSTLQEAREREGTD